MLSSFWILLSTMHPNICRSLCIGLCKHSDPDNLPVNDRIAVHRINTHTLCLCHISWRLLWLSIVCLLASLSNFLSKSLVALAFCECTYLAFFGDFGKELAQRLEFNACCQGYTLGHIYTHMHFEESCTAAESKESGEGESSHLIWSHIRSQSSQVLT